MHSTLETSARIALAIALVASFVAVPAAAAPGQSTLAGDGHDAATVTTDSDHLSFADDEEETETQDDDVEVGWEIKYESCYTVASFMTVKLEVCYEYNPAE